MAGMIPRAAIDQMAVSLARQLARQRKVQIGINAPLAETAALLAKRIAPGRLTVYLHAMSGAHRQPSRASLFRSEWDAVIDGCSFPVETLLDLLSGREGVDDEPLSPLQIDGHGQVNLTGIGDGRGGWRLLGPGTAGLDILPYMRHGTPTLYCTRHSTRVLVEEVDVVTAWPREGRGVERDRETLLVTELCIFALSARHGARLKSLHAHASIDDVRERTGFAFACAAEPRLTEPPSEQELALLDEVDPRGIRGLEFLSADERADRILEVWREEAATQ